MAATLLPPIRNWHCPACDTRDLTQQAEAHTQFHNCPAIGGLGLPMVEVKSHDHIADAQFVLNKGEKGNVASISTHHGSGRVDCTVFPEPAVLSMRGHY